MAAKKQAPAERKLVAYVYVDGVCYGPDSEVPAEVAEAITNPKAWGEATEVGESAD